VKNRDNAGCGDHVSLSADLFNHDVNLIAIFHVELLGGLSLVQAFSIKQEADVGGIELNREKLTLWRWQ
jgi:hypothetical protein